MLTDDEKRALMTVAREAITGALQGKPRQRHALATGRLGQPGGAFVTLRLDGDLRGCIGYIESPLALEHVVAEVAVKAAFEDPRFAPLSGPELNRVSLEISVLSPLRKMERTEELEVGVHGLLLECKGRRGLLLPQVATEYGFDRGGFLDATARKAGLPAGAWRDPEAEIFLFSAEVFHESDVVLKRHPP